MVIGATSGIATAAQQLWVDRETEFYLIARDQDKLDELASDLIRRGAKGVFKQIHDATDTFVTESLISKAFEKCGPFDIALIAVGMLPDQERDEVHVEKTVKGIQVNAVGVVAYLVAIANHMRTQRKGSIVVISSISGVVARRSNYLYGSAKSLVSTFVIGLAYRLFQHNISVIDFRPGPVDTAMTNSVLQKRFYWSSCVEQAKNIDRAIKKRKIVYYSPFYWRYVMYLFRYIPKSLIRWIDV